MTHIEQLLQKYTRPYVPGEIRSNEYNRQIKKESRHKNRLLILDELNNELPYSIKLHKHEKEIINSILKVFQDDLKILNRTATEEQIILTIIFQVKKRVKPNLRIEDYSIFTKYKLTNSMLITILCRLNNYYMATHPLIIKETVDYDHELLYEQKNNLTGNGYKYNK